MLPPIFLYVVQIKIISIVLVEYYEGALVDLLENTSLTFPITKERPKGRGRCCPHASNSLIYWQLLFASIDCRSSTFWLSPPFFGHQSPHWLFGPEFGVLEIGTPCSQYAHFVKQPLKENIDTCIKRTHVFSSFRHLPGPKYPQEMVRVLSDLWGKPPFFHLESHFQVASHLVSGCQPWLVGSLRLLTIYIYTIPFLS